MIFRARSGLFSWSVCENRGGGLKARAWPRNRCSRAYFHLQACPDDHIRLGDSGEQERAIHGE
jgi:hypothetical protein